MDILLKDSKKDSMAGISTEVGFIIWCKNRASAVCLSSQASFMAHFDHIGFTEPRVHGGNGGRRSIHLVLTSSDCVDWHPRGCAEGNLQSYSLFFVYLKLAAAPCRPLQLVFERGGLLSDRLEDFVQLEVLRVRLAVHRLVLRPLLRWHDRNEVAGKKMLS